MLYKLLLRDIGLDEQALQKGGLRIYTTLDPKLQSVAEQAVKTTYLTRQTYKLRSSL